MSLASTLGAAWARDEMKDNPATWHVPQAEANLKMAIIDVLSRHEEELAIARQAIALKDVELTELRQALVYVAHAMHSTPIHMSCKGLMLIDGDAVRVTMGDVTVDTGRVTLPS